MLNQESGLKGISGISGDMRDIGEAIENDNKRAQLAFDIYVHRVRFYIGAMLASLDRLDALIFTAGIGENSASFREAVCDKFNFLGLENDANENANNPLDTDIATSASRTKALVIQAQEDWAIARECFSLQHLAVR